MENPDFCWWRCSTTWKYEKCEPHFEASDQKKSEAQNPTANIPPVLVQWNWKSQEAQKNLPWSHWSLCIAKLKPSNTPHPKRCQKRLASSLTHLSSSTRHLLPRTTLKEYITRRGRTTIHLIDEDRWRSMKIDAEIQSRWTLWHNVTQWIWLRSYRVKNSLVTNIKQLTPVLFLAAKNGEKRRKIVGSVSVPL